MDVPSHAAEPAHRRGPGRYLLIGVVVAIVVAAGVLLVGTVRRSGETTQGAATPADAEPPLSSIRPALPPPTPMATDTAPADGALQSDFATLRSETAGTIGIVALPLGGGAPVVLGDWSSGAAWSTSKVPLSIAALRADPPADTGLVTSAITASDNASAEALWSGLGDPETAAEGHLPRGVTLRSRETAGWSPDVEFWIERPTWRGHRRHGADDLSHP